MSLPRPSGLKAPSRLARPSHVAAPPSASKAHGPEHGAASSQEALGFMIGDRVWVGGSKAGVIAYLGETKFAPGDWAGVVLDLPIGKNDGSVAGVSYFQCEPKRGVFSRPAKLTREPTDEAPTPAKPPATPSSQNNTSGDKDREAMPPPTAFVAPDVAASIEAKPPATPNATVATPGGSRLRPPRSRQGSFSSAAGAPEGGELGLRRTESLANLAKTRPDLTLGDRVIVSGTKTGILRFFGPAEFAKGDWCGVELDEKQGKNNGAVQGVRYFECEPLFGLFAPAHKVTKQGSAAAPKPVVTPSRPSNRSNLLSRRHRTGSNESMSSVGSSVSTASRSRLSVVSRTSLASRTGLRTGTPARPKPSTTTKRSSTVLSASTALQEALKEKEQHVEQLLQERDMERSEIARASVRADEAEQALKTQKTDHEKQLEELQKRVAELTGHVENGKTEREELQQQLAEETRKFEDLQFEMEEKALLDGGSDKSPVKTKPKEENEESEKDRETAEKLRQMEKRCKEEINKVDTLQHELITIKAVYEKERTKSKDIEESSVAYLDQIEVLTHKLTMAESKIAALDASTQQRGDESESLSTAVTERDLRIAELEEDLASKDKQLRTLETKMADLCEEVRVSGTKQEQLNKELEEMRGKVTAAEGGAETARAEAEEARSNLTDVQRQLTAAEETREQTVQDKNKLEQQLSDMTKNSGDSSQQLTLLNEKLRESDRELETVNGKLRASHQEVSRVTEQLEQSRAAHEREHETLLEKHQADLKKLAHRGDELQGEVEKASKKYSEAESKWESEREEMVKQQKEKQETMKKEIDKKEVEVKEARAQAVAQLTEAMEVLKAELEKEQVERKTHMEQVEALEGDKFKLEEESVGLQAEREILMQEKEKLELKLKGLEEIVEGFEKEKTEFSNVRVKDVESLDELRGRHAGLVQGHEVLAMEKVELENKLAEKDGHVKDVRLQVEKMKNQFERNVRDLQEARQAAAQDTQQLEELHKQLQSNVEKEEGVRKQLQEADKKRKELEQELEKSRSSSLELQKIEADRDLLQEEVNVLNERESEVRQEKAAEIKALQEQTEKLSQQLQEKDKAVGQQQQELAFLQGQTSLLSSYKTQLETAAREKTALEQRVASLQQHTPNNNAADTDNKRGGDGGLAHQVDFLNGVIVQQQEENARLKKELAAALDHDLGLNGTQDDSLNDSPPKRAAAPRLFCDICDVFDAHDTEDCPAQAMEDASAHSHHQADKTEQRPYCDTCEVFGHATADCEDDETF